MRKVLIALLVPLLAWGGLAFLLDRAGPRAVPPGTWDAVVVAGCRVLENGAPSDCLRARAAAGAGLWTAGRAPLLVLTGGVGEFPPSEAEAAARVARSAGVPPEAMVLEDTSTSTEENARRAAALLGPGARVLVVTDAWHAPRVQRVFGRHFAEATAVGIDGTAARRVRGSLREVLAVAWYAVRGRL